MMAQDYRLDSIHPLTHPPTYHPPIHVLSLPIRTGIGLTAAPPAMGHADEHFICINDNLPGGLLLELGDQTHAAGITFVGAVVQPLLRGETRDEAGRARRPTHPSLQGAAGRHRGGGGGGGGSSRSQQARAPRGEEAEHAFFLFACYPVAVGGWGWVNEMAWGE